MGTSTRTSIPAARSARAGTYTQAAYNNNNDRQNMMNQTDWTYKFYTDVLKHTSCSAPKFANQQIPPTPASAVCSATAATSGPISASKPTTFRRASAFTGLATDARNRTDLNVAAVYAQDQIELTRWLQFIGGVRFEQFDLDYVNLNAPRHATSMARHFTRSTISFRRAPAWCSSRSTRCRSMAATACRICRRPAISSAR